MHKHTSQPVVWFLSNLLSLMLLLTPLLVSAEENIPSNAVPSVQAEGVSIDFIGLTPSSIQVTVDVQQLSSERLQLEDGRSCERFIIPDEPELLREGFPALPFVSRAILIPTEGDVSFSVSGIRIKKNCRRQTLPCR